MPPEADTLEVLMAHRHLDRMNVPRSTSEGMELSLTGRIALLTERRFLRV